MLKTFFVWMLLAFVLISTVDVAEAQRRRRTRKKPRQTQVLREQCEAVTPQSFVIAPGKYSYFTFGLPEAHFGGTVSGRFRAQGGSGNDVEVFILNQDGFENFQNGHSVQTFYNSRRATVGSVDFSVGSGESYYLIVSNTFSSFSNKAVTSDITLCYKYYEMTQ